MSNEKKTIPRFSEMPGVDRRRVADVLSGRAASSADRAYSYIGDRRDRTIEDKIRLAGTNLRRALAFCSALETLGFSLHGSVTMERVRAVSRWLEDCQNGTSTKPAEQEAES